MLTSLPYLRRAPESAPSLDHLLYVLVRLNSLAALLQVLLPHSKVLTGTVHACERFLLDDHQDITLQTDSPR